MALSANSVFEVRTAGNDTNGGGFVTGAAGTDYSQQDAKRTATGADDSTTDAVAVGTTTITSVTAAFGTTIVGNIIYFEGGTGTIAACWRQVTARASASSITIDAAIAASTGMTMNIGGALGSPGMAGGVGLVTGNIIHIKAGTYAVTSATPNITAGCFSSSLQTLILQGYETTRGDFGAAPLMQASGISTFTLITTTGTKATTLNIDLDGAGLTAAAGFSAFGIVYKCAALNMTGTAFAASTACTFVRCRATGCTVTPFGSTGVFIGCVAHDNTATGFLVSASNWAIGCIADTNTGASSDGFELTGANLAGGVRNCTAYNNGRDGIRLSQDTKSVGNCIAELNAGYGINANNRTGALFVNNATYNNTSGGINLGTGKGIVNLNPVAGSGSFFVDAPNRDFALNATAGAGAAARAVGYPGVLAVGGTGYLDIGALQHADPAQVGGRRPRLVTVR